MAEKILQTRILNKIDTLEAWNSSSLKIKQGEICLATVAASAGTGLTEPVVMAKIGTAEEKTFAELPWSFYAKASDVLEACKTTEGLTAFVNGVIADAGIASSDAMEALAGRVTTAEGEIDTLQSEMDAVEAKAAANETAIGDLEDLVGDKAVATQISEAIAALDLANTYEAKGEAAKVQTALDTYKTSNDAAVLANTNAISANTSAITAIKDGTTIDSFADVETALAGKETAGAAAQALADAKTYADGLAGNYDAKGSAAQALTDAKAYADGLADNYDAAGSAAGALTDAKAYTDAEIEEWVGDKTVGTQISEAITGLDLANTYAAKSHTHVKADITDFAHTHEMSEVNGLEAALEGKQAVGDYATKTEAQAMADAKDEAIEAAQAAADKAQEEVDALETYVGTIPEGYSEATVIAYIDKKAEEAVATAGAGASNVLGQLNSYKVDNDAAVQANADAIDALETLVGDKAVSTQISDAVAAEETRAKGVESGLETRLAAVESDYLKAADKTELEEAIATNASAIELLTNGVDAEKVDGVNDLIKYVEEHGTEVTGMKADISANATAIATEKSRAEGVEAELQTAINGVAADVEELQGEVDTKAAQSDLEALAGRVTTAEDSITTNITNIVANKVSITALEALVGDTSVATQISTAVAAEAEIARAAEKANADAIDALEAKAHEHANKDVLDGVSAEKVASWDAAVQTVTAGTGLTATKTGTDVAIAFDDSVTFIFDCGGAE